MTEQRKNIFAGEQWIAPPLFAVCQQTRYEAAPIYFKAHTFNVFVRRLDARTLRSWLSLSLVQEQQEIDIVAGIPNASHLQICRLVWYDVLEWCEAVKKGRTNFTLQQPPRMGRGIKVLCEALAIAEEYRDRPWRECREALETMRQAYDPREDTDEEE